MSSACSKSGLVVLVLLLLTLLDDHYSCNASLIDPTKSKQISSKPRAFVYRGFLTDQECDHLISLAKSELKRSQVADNLSGKGTLSEVRTSSGMFITKGKIWTRLLQHVPGRV